MKLTFKLITLTLLAFSFYLNAHSQTDLNKRIIVYFKTGVLKNTSTDPVSVTITSTNISQLLNSFNLNANNVTPAFPDFNEADTVKAELGEISRQMNYAKVYVISLSSISNKSAIINSLKNLNEVLYAESDGEATSNLIPVDTRYGQQWNLNNQFITGADIHAEGAWDIFTGNPNSIIAFFDEGVDVTHNDLSAKILGGDNGFGIRAEPLVGDISHGSHVAGIAAAITDNNNNNGIAGVDWQARIQPRYVIGNSSGDIGITQAINNSINFSDNVWTFNHSWGTNSGRDLEDNPIPGRYSVTIRSAFAKAYRANRVSCVAMGNHQAYSGSIYANQVGFPAGFNSGIITVGATNISDNIGNFSAQGPHIDVTAPGVDILSTNFNNQYVNLTGTSMATPQVAGLASLLKGFNTNLANDDIEQIIRLSADDKGVLGFDNAFGTGRINAERALQFLQAPNVVQHLSATGGTIHSTSGNITRIFLGVPGIPDGVYTVRRSEVRKNITFPTQCTLIGVWGRGNGTTGYREENGYNFGEGICEIVQGTQTNTSVTLRTWIYEVISNNGQNLGFFPRSANNVVFQYTVLGRPSAPPFSLAAEIVSCEEVQFNVIGNASSPFNWTVTSGEILFNGNTTTASTTSNSIYATGTTGSVSVSSTNACGVPRTTSVTYDPFPRGPFNIPNPMLRQDQLSVNVNPTPSDTYYRWYVNGVLVKEGQYETSYCTCNYEGPDQRQCGNNIVRVEVDQCNSTSFYEEEFEWICNFRSQNNVELYPNPASTTVTMRLTSINEKETKDFLKDIREVKLFDKLGNLKRVIKYAAKTNFLSIHTTDLVSDVYYIEVSDGFKKVKLPLIVKK